MGMQSERNDELYSRPSCSYESAGLSSPTADQEDICIFENKSGLGEDMKFLASMPELCDVTFLVGDTRAPVCAVKAVLAARSKVFRKILYESPSPQKKKDASQLISEKKITAFLKRSSEPLLSTPATILQKQGAQHRTILIEEFEPDVFRQLIEYVHTGCVTLQPRTLLGVLNAADYYGLEELRAACVAFLQCCITVDTVCPLLSTADRYVQYKCTKSMLQKVLAFVDEHGNEVLNLGSFTLIPKHVVMLILSREELRADEFTKFQAALMWTKKHCDNHNIDWKPLFQESFVPLIQYHKIPANILKNEIVPLKVVPDDIIITALAYQKSGRKTEGDRRFADLEFTVLTETVILEEFEPGYSMNRSMKMALSLSSPAFKAALPLIMKRNMGSSYVLMAKSADPVQQLFVDKIREFGAKINDKNFAKEYPELQKALDDELQRVTRQYGGEKPDDLLKFPDVKMHQPELDTHQGIDIR